MSQIGIISINDGESTPVAHVFNPKQVYPAAMYRRDMANLAQSLTESIKLEVKPSPKQPLTEVYVELKIPVQEQLSSGAATGYVAAPKEAFHEKVEVKFTLHDRGTAATAKNLRVLAANLLAHATVIEAVEKREKPM